MNERRFSVNGKSHGGKNDISLPDRQQQASQAVADIMDQINELLAEAEKKLKALQPTHNAAILIDADLPDNCEWQFKRYLGFIKCDSMWRICYSAYEESVLYPEQCRGDTGWKPLADCPRTIRAQVVSRFPELLPSL